MSADEGASVFLNLDFDLTVDANSNVDSRAMRASSGSALALQRRLRDKAEEEKQPEKEQSDVQRRLAAMYKDITGFSPKNSSFSKKPKPKKRKKKKRKPEAKPTVQPKSQPQPENKEAISAPVGIQLSIRDLHLVYQTRDFNKLEQDKDDSPPDIHINLTKTDHQYSLRDIAGGYAQDADSSDSESSESDLSGVHTNVVKTELEMEPIDSEAETDPYDERCGLGWIFKLQKRWLAYLEEIHSSPEAWMQENAISLESKSNGVYVKLKNESAFYPGWLFLLNEEWSKHISNNLSAQEQLMEARHDFDASCPAGIYICLGGQQAFVPESFLSMLKSGCQPEPESNSNPERRHAAVPSETGGAPPLWWLPTTEQKKAEESLPTIPEVGSPENNLRQPVKAKKSLLVFGFFLWAIAAVLGGYFQEADGIAIFAYVTFFLSGAVPITTFLNSRYGLFNCACCLSRNSLSQGSNNEDDRAGQMPELSLA